MSACCSAASPPCATPPAPTSACRRRGSAACSKARACSSPAARSRRPAAMPTCARKGVRRRDVLQLRRPGAVRRHRRRRRRGAPRGARAGAQGANQIKIMAGGGVSSPTDPIDGTQFSLDELRRHLRGGRGRQPLRAGPCLFAACRHARGAGGRAQHRARQPDRRGHGARDEGAHGAYLVPTLATYAALADEGAGWAGRRRCWTSSAVQDRGRGGRLARPRACRSSSAPTCWATCTTARTASSRCAPRCRRRCDPAGATIGGARLMRAGRPDRPAGARRLADLLVVDGDPTQRGRPAGRAGHGIRLLMQGGRVVRDSGRPERQTAGLKRRCRGNGQERGPTGPLVDGEAGAT
jgi:hypothetical protein